MYYNLNELNRISEQKENATYVVGFEVNVSQACTHNWSIFLRQYIIIHTAFGIATVCSE